MDDDDDCAGDDVVVVVVVEGSTPLATLLFPSAITLALFFLFLMLSVLLTMVFFLVLDESRTPIARGAS